uniref:Uncharacterized protein n=1 Tax=Anguilla anguilla TaxID=7936 RepID=A0A0E9T0L2_ANGAN
MVTLDDYRCSHQNNGRETGDRGLARSTPGRAARLHLHLC